MDIFLGILWLVVTLLITLFIQGNIFKKKSYIRIGFALIILSFVCGITILVVAIFSN